MVDLPRFDPLAPHILPHPYPAYAELRRRDPVHWGLADDAGLPGRWYVTRFDDVTALLKDPRFGREVDTGAPDLAALADDELLSGVARGWMILRDPPVHTRLRTLAQAAYAPRRVQQLRDHVRDTAHRLIDRMLAQGPPLDLLDAFALPLTVAMTAHMLGLPEEAADRLTPWSRSLAALIDLNLTPARRRESRQALAEFMAFLQPILDARRSSPQDDLISALLHTGAAGEPLTDDEITGTVTHLLFVGNDPVMHLFGNALITLDEHPDARARLLAEPALLPNGLDELMRYDSPVQMTFRYALQDLEFGGKAIRKGDHVAVVLGSANRDPACVPDPDRLDVTRPVGQVAHFGMGIHYCLGAPLARMEGQVGLAALFDRLPHLAPASGVRRWQPTVAVRGVETLLVRF